MDLLVVGNEGFETVVERLLMVEVKHMDELVKDDGIDGLEGSLDELGVERHDSVTGHMPPAGLECADDKSRFKVGKRSVWESRLQLLAKGCLKLFEAVIEAFAKKAFGLLGEPTARKPLDGDG